MIIVKICLRAFGIEIASITRKLLQRIWMRIELFENWIQISIDEKSAILKKAKSFALKHFAEFLQLSSSVIVLDEEKERYKKRYFINWIYHLSVTKERDKERVLLAKLLGSTHLPIRIKTTSNSSVVENVKVSMEMLSNDRTVFRLDKQNRLARRYLISSFREHIVGYGKKELFLDNTKEAFWEQLIATFQEKIIHNVSLQFEYDKHGSNNARFESHSAYHTASERILRKAYAILECDINDTFEKIKTTYLKMAKEYHPDRVHGQDELTIKRYTEKFRLIQEAYETIKNNHHLAA